VNYLLDTNIIVIYLRDNEMRNKIESEYNPFGVENNPIISIVTVGEIKSIGKRNFWGSRKLNLLEEILNTLVITDINSKDVVEMYAEIDTFSQGKMKEKPLGMSARNMGKNYLWIAATSSVTNSKLLTTDKDFEHLHQTYFEVIKIAQ